MKVKSATPGCDNCRKKKKGCDRGTPCGLCVANGVRCVYTAALSGSNSQRGFGRQIQASGGGPGYATTNSTYPSAPGSYAIPKNGQNYGRENDENIKKNVDQYNSSFRASDQYINQHYGRGASASPYQSYGSYSGQSDMNNQHQDSRNGYRASSNQYSTYGPSGSFRSRSTDQSANNQNHNPSSAYHYHPSACYPYAVDPKYLVPFNRRNYTYQRQHDRLRFEEYFQSSSSSAHSSRSFSDEPVPSGQSDQFAPASNALQPPITASISATPASASSTSSSSSNSFLGFHASVSIQDQTRKKGALIPSSVKTCLNDQTRLSGGKEVCAAPMEPQDTAAALLLWEFQLKSQFAIR